VLENDVYTVITYTGTGTNVDTNHLAVINSPGYEYSLVDPATTAGEVKIKIEVAFGFDYWIGYSGSTTWDHAAANWIRNGAPNGVFEDTDVVNITDGAMNASLNALQTNINLVGDLDIAGLYVTNTGAPFTLQGTGRMTGTNGAGYIAGNKPVTIANSGTNDWTGAMTVGFDVDFGEPSILQIGNGGAAGSMPGRGAVTNQGVLLFTGRDR